MLRYFAVAAFAILVLLVLSRAVLLRKKGVKALRFGEMDKKDFIIPPFALFYFYLILAGAFGLPGVGSELFSSAPAGWVGVVLCALALALFLYALVSFGLSFRVGIDEDHPGPLVTSGAFAFCRNPIYTAFVCIFIGIFLIIPNWIFLIYIVAGAALIHRQVLREEASLKKIYGKAYLDYCKRVRRYL